MSRRDKRAATLGYAYHDRAQRRAAHRVAYNSDERRRGRLIDEFVDAVYAAFRSRRRPW